MSCLKLCLDQALSKSLQGSQYKPVTGGLLLPVGPLTTVCLDFINENKDIICLQIKILCDNLTIFIVTM